MNDKLIEGYLAYTSADELNVSATSDAPATPIVLATTGIFVSGVGIGIASVTAHC